MRPGLTAARRRKPGTAACRRNKENNQRCDAWGRQAISDQADFISFRASGRQWQAVAPAGGIEETTLMQAT